MDVMRLWKAFSGKSEGDEAREQQRLRGGVHVEVHRGDQQNLEDSKVKENDVVKMKDAKSSNRLSMPIVPSTSTSVASSSTTANVMEESVVLRRRGGPRVSSINVNHRLSLQVSPSTTTWTSSSSTSSTLTPKSRRRASLPAATKTHWESLDVSVSRVDMKNDDISSMVMNEWFVVVQHLSEPQLDVFDLHSFEHVVSLQGHLFGGQCLCLRSMALYSGSMDKSVRSWRLQGLQSTLVETTFNHVDYVNVVAIDNEGKWVASGGRGDHTIFVYHTDPETCKLWRRHQLLGHDDHVTLLLFTSSSTLISASADSSLRIWHVGSRDAHCLRTLYTHSEITSGVVLTDMAHTLLADTTGRISALAHDDPNFSMTHILPRVLTPNTNVRARSSRFHSANVDLIHVTSDRRFLLTASHGSRAVKIWQMNFDNNPDDCRHELVVEVGELQVLTDFSDLINAVCVDERGGRILSACSDANLFTHVFPTNKPHYEMAFEEEKSEDNCVAALISRCGKSGSLISSKHEGVARCPGPDKCAVGRSGVVRSSSSFKVNFHFTNNKAAKTRMGGNLDNLPEEYSDDEDEDSDSDDEEDEYSEDEEEDDEDEDEDSDDFSDESDSNDSSLDNC